MSPTDDDSRAGRLERSAVGRGAHWNWGLYWIGLALGVGLVVGVILLRGLGG